MPQDDQFKPHHLDPVPVPTPIVVAGEKSVAVNELTDGVRGESPRYGVHGVQKPKGGTKEPKSGAGVFGESANGLGVAGGTEHAFGFLAGSHPFFGDSTGVYGESEQLGVAGHSTGGDGTGVFGNSSDGPGGWGVRGETTDGIGVQGEALGNGVAVVGRGGRLAAWFDGNVEISGELNFSHADCAEDFDISGISPVEAGTVMVLSKSGGLCASFQAYDRRVAGVISGAGEYKPGIVLDKQESGNLRQPLALVGKVFCKVDADLGSIEIGDMLTTSPTAGHAMKADDPARAFGSVIGKALRPLESGKGLVPILISLQ